MNTSDEYVCFIIRVSCSHVPFFSSNVAMSSLPFALTKYLILLSMMQSTEFGQSSHFVDSDTVMSDSMELLTSVYTNTIVKVNLKHFCRLKEFLTIFREFFRPQLIVHIIQWNINIHF